MEIDESAVFSDHRSDRFAWHSGDLDRRHVNALGDREALPHLVQSCPGCLERRSTRRTRRRCSQEFDDLLVGLARHECLLVVGSSFPIPTPSANPSVPGRRPEPLLIEGDVTVFRRLRGPMPAPDPSFDHATA